MLYFRIRSSRFLDTISAIFFSQLYPAFLDAVIPAFRFLATSHSNRSLYSTYQLRSHVDDLSLTRNWRSWGVIEILIGESMKLHRRSRFRKPLKPFRGFVFAHRKVPNSLRRPIGSTGGGDRPAHRYLSVRPPRIRRFARRKFGRQQRTGNSRIL